MTASKLIKEVAKSDEPDLPSSLNTLEQLLSVLALAGTNVTINLNVTPASQSRGEASPSPGTGDLLPIASSLTPCTNDSGTGESDPSLTESPVTPPANDGNMPIVPCTDDGDMGDSSPVVPCTDDGDTGDSSPVAPRTDGGGTANSSPFDSVGESPADSSPTESPADNRQGCHLCVCAMCRRRTVCAPLGEGEGSLGVDLNPPGSSSEDNALRWYTVTVGRRVGIFSQWATVVPLVVSVSGACFAHYPSCAAAETAFALALNNHNVRIIN